jgi:hypothetical protein
MTTRNEVNQTAAGTATRGEVDPTTKGIAAGDEDRPFAPRLMGTGFKAAQEQEEAVGQIR